MFLKMSAKFLCCVLMSMMLFTLSVNAGCVCNEKGVDYCNKCKPPTFVRPKPKPRPAYINAELELKPISDTCSCNKIFVEPAPLPKACNKSVPKPPTCKCSSAPCKYCSPAPLPPPAPAPHKSCGCGTSPAFPSYPLPAAAHATPQDNGIPADPISISLALQASKAVAVPEAKLAYGFAKPPIDSMKKITFANVPEENLFQLKSEVITFKKPALTPSPEEEEEPYEEEQVEAADQPPTFTYSQLGYEPEKFKNPKFRKVVSCGHDYSSGEAHALPDKVHVDCGYRPGRIAAYVKVKPKKEESVYY
ncbi:uncharacterized protein Cp7Fa [Eurosta solidaginis]|uniref:uncharacterized protein Cp7Fa n=1 Tax=Eurosta solidaginis TaxID=178769 RepID=UPI0035315BFE